MVICQVCKEKESIYQCPNCEQRYCSITCYKNHNQSCVERFCEKQVKENLKALKPNLEEIQIFKKSLWKLHKLDYNEKEVDEIGSLTKDFSNEDIKEQLGENSSSKKFAKRQESNAENEEIEEQDFSIDDERLNYLIGLAERDELSEEHLKDNELESFHEFICQDKILNNLPVIDKMKNSFSPWWTKCELLKVEHPPPHICCTKARAASEVSEQSIIQLLYAYSFLTRLYMGDWEHDREEILIELFSISKNLTHNSNTNELTYQTLNEILETQNQILGTTNEQKRFASNILLDVIELLSHKERVCRSLQDLKAFFKKCIKRQITEKGKNNGPEQYGITRDLKLAIKKIDFYLSYVWHHSEGLERQMREIQIIYETRKLILDKEEESKVESHTNTPSGLKILDELGACLRENKIKKTSKNNHSRSFTKSIQEVRN